MSGTMIELQARHEIEERIRQASAPRVPRTSTRHRLAERLRRVADRVDT